MSLPLGSQLLQAQQAGAQQVKGGDVALNFAQIEGGGEDFGVLFEHPDGLAAEELGLVAHLGEAAHLFGAQGDEGGEEFFDGGDGLVEPGDVGSGEFEGNQVLAHGNTPGVEVRHRQPGTARNITLPYAQGLFRRHFPRPAGAPRSGH